MTNAEMQALAQIGDTARIIQRITELQAEIQALQNLLGSMKGNALGNAYHAVLGNAVPNWQLTQGDSNYGS